MTETRYYVSKSEDASGTTHKFKGPGMPQYTNEVHLIQPLNFPTAKRFAEGTDLPDYDAKKILCMLNAAFDAGRKSMTSDIRRMLGVVDP